MPSADYEFRFYNAGINDLEKYLISDELYWPIAARTLRGEPPYPRLTLGSLLLFKTRIHVRDLTQKQQADLQKLDSQMDESRTRWRAAWGKKTLQDFQARLKLWSNYLSEYKNNPSANADRYSYEIGRRVMLQLLGQEVEDLPASEKELLSSEDSFLGTVLLRGPFIWDGELQGGFPEKEYWFLYGRLKDF